MNRKINIPQIIVVSLVLVCSMAVVAHATLTISGTGITGDGAFGLTGAASSTWDVGSGNTILLQTTNNGPITAGTGLFTMRGAATVSTTLSVGTTTAAAGAALTVSTIDNGGTISIGNSSGTQITIGRNGQNVLFPGNVSSSGALTLLSTLTQSGGVVSLASTTITGNATATTLSVTGAATLTSALTQSGGVVALASTTITGQATATTMTVTGAATFSSTLTQSGGVVSLASTTVSGHTTSTSLVVTGSTKLGAGTAILKHLSGTSSHNFGAIASSTCVTTSTALTGAAAGDVVLVSPTPVASGIETVTANWSAYASTTDTVALRVCNPSISNTAAVANQTWRFDVWQH